MSDYSLRLPRLLLAGLLALLPALAARAGDARGVPLPLQPVTALANGVNHACAIADGGTVYCWGYNLYGQLGSGDDTSTIDPTPVRGLPGPAVALAAGMHHSCAVAAGQVWCWGNNDYGQLGNDNPDGTLVPVAVQGLGGTATAVTAGYYHTCAVVDNGIKCWGSNAYGSLGNGTDDDTYQPVSVSGLSGPFSQIAAGLLHTCATNAAGGRHPRLPSSKLLRYTSIPPMLATSGGIIAASVLPIYSSVLERGVLSSGSRLRRSFSPTNVSSAITSEIEIGKNPTIISRKGIVRSPIISAP